MFTKYGNDAVVTYELRVLFERFGHLATISGTLIITQLVGAQTAA
jgi:hypothetical protein